MPNRTLTLAAALVLLAACGDVGDEEQPKSAAAPVSTTRPDLTGFYDVATLTPLVRPKEYGENLYLTPDEAQAIAADEARLSAERDRNRGPATEAPPVGGAPPVGLGEEALEQYGAGAVGGYNHAFVDRGSDVFMIDGKFRTSIIVDPPNGQLPEMTPEAIAAAMERRKLRRPNTGEAWWLDLEGPGPYDGPESLGTPNVA